MAKRPERPCTWCGHTTVSLRRICNACQARAAREQQPGHQHALTGGTWRPARGILRWQPDLEEAS